MQSISVWPSYRQKGKEIKAPRAILAKAVQILLKLDDLVAREKKEPRKIDAGTSILPDIFKGKIHIGFTFNTKPAYRGPDHTVRVSWFPNQGVIYYNWSPGRRNIFRLKDQRVITIAQALQTINDRIGKKEAIGVSI